MKPLGAHDAALPASLKSFFEAMEEVVFADAPPRLLQERLGPTPSGDARFDFYRQLAFANPRRTLRSTFRATARLCERHADGLFDQLVERHFAQHPPTGWELTRVTEHFETTVEQAAEALTLPDGIAEVVDYETLRQRVLFFELDVPTAGQPHPSCEVRTYSFDVPAFVTAVRQATDASTVHPGGDAVTCLFYRDKNHGRLMTRTPHLGHLVALALAEADADPDLVTQAGLTQQQVSAARAELIAWGAFVGP